MIDHITNKIFASIIVTFHLTWTKRCALEYGFSTFLHLRCKSSGQDVMFLAVE